MRNTSHEQQAVTTLINTTTLQKCGKSHTHLRGARKSVIQNCTKDALHIQYKTFYDLGTAFADKCKRLQPVNGPEQKER